LSDKIFLTGYETPSENQGFLIKNGHVMKKIFLIVLSLCLLNLISWTPPSSAREVIYGIDAKFPPFVYLRNGIPSGFDVEVIKAIFEGKDIDLIFKIMPWDNVLKALADGSIHITSGVDKTFERLKIYDFALFPLVSDDVKIFVKEEKGIDGLKDLKGKNVSTLKGASYQSLLENIGDINLHLFNSETDALKALNNSTVEAFVGTVKPARFNIKIYGYRDMKEVGTPIFKSTMYLAVRKGDKELLELINRGQQEIINNGVYEKIYRKWFIEERYF